MKPRCPTCKQALPEPSPSTAPFCNPRCKAADLGSWLDGKYVVASPAFAGDSDNPEDNDADLLN
jgi:endogenous inhibitor of DNA gyrase (YacG/DUF329 family)